MNESKWDASSGRQPTVPHTLPYALVMFQLETRKWFDKFQREGDGPLAALSIFLKKMAPQ